MSTCEYNYMKKVSLPAASFSSSLSNSHLSSQMLTSYLSSFHLSSPDFSLPHLFSPLFSTLYLFSLLSHYPTCSLFLLTSQLSSFLLISLLSFHLVSLLISLYMSLLCSHSLLLRFKKKFCYCLEWLLSTTPPSYVLC